MGTVAKIANKMKNLGIFHVKSETGMIINFQDPNAKDQNQYSEVDA